MLNTQQTISAENVINMVWDSMNHARGNISLGEIFTPTLAVLYAIHKGYGVIVYDNHHLEFNLNDDKLYCDLVNLVPNDKHLHTAMCHFIRELSFIKRDEFNSVYVEVLRGLFDLVSSSSGREGADFIFLNRNNKSKEQAHDFDIVYGPIANDRVGVQIGKYEAGDITLDQFLENLKYMKGITFQYFFGTEAALTKLTKI